MSGRPDHLRVGISVGLVDQGGVSIDGEKVSDANATLPSKKEFVLKVGKRKFLKVLR